MAYKRKTRDIWEIQGRYDGSWELETQEESWRAAKEQVKVYIDNCPYTTFRIVKKRERI